VTAFWDHAQRFHAFLLDGRESGAKPLDCADIPVDEQQEHAQDADADQSRREPP
jgi:hypothetical protein